MSRYYTNHDDTGVVKLLCWLIALCMFGPIVIAVKVGLFILACLFEAFWNDDYIGDHRIGRR